MEQKSQEKIQTSLLKVSLRQKNKFNIVSPNTKAINQVLKGDMICSVLSKYFLDQRMRCRNVKHIGNSDFWTEEQIILILYFNDFNDIFSVQSLHSILNLTGNSNIKHLVGIGAKVYTDTFLYLCSNLVDLSFLLYIQ